MLCCEYTSVIRAAYILHSHDTLTSNVGLCQWLNNMTNANINTFVSLINKFMQVWYMSSASLRSPGMTFSFSHKSFVVSHISY